MQNNSSQSQVPPVPPAASSSEDVEESGGGAQVVKNAFKDVMRKIREGENVLVALSDNPSVDELAGAIGLSLALSAAGKHATAIYSGKTPNVLEFLNPGETFEVNTDSLQDFIIALNKEKADHLRYKIEGDYVKVYITPYKTTISEGDLEFSRGDFNVDLVVSLNVPAATELDGALREYGRIMHDATTVNITNGAPGKFGDFEWVDPNASSVSEMVARVAMELNKELDETVATALFSGIAFATDKFTNQATTSEVMKLAAKLMEFGADQREVMKNLSQEVVFSDGGEATSVAETETKNEEEVPAEGQVSSAEDMTHLAISHEKEVTKEEPQGVMKVAEEANVAQAVTTSAEGANAEALGAQAVGVASVGTGEASGAGVALAEAPAVGTPEGAGLETSMNEETGQVDYGKMIDDALAEPLPGEVPIGEVMVKNAGGAIPPVEESAFRQTARAIVNKVGDTFAAGISQMREGAGGESGAQGVEGALGAENMQGMGGVSGAEMTPGLGVPGAEGMQGGGQELVGSEGRGGVAVNPVASSDVVVTPDTNIVAENGNDIGMNGGEMPEAQGIEGVSQDEIDALNVIKQGQAKAAEDLGLGATGELPRIVPQRGTVGYEAPEGATMNPATMQAPGVQGMQAAGNVPNMDYLMGGTQGSVNGGDFGGAQMGGMNGGFDGGVQMGGMQMNDMNGGMNGEAQGGFSGGSMAGATEMSGVLPMPGQEMTPPPVTPMPDFTTMPPVQNMPSEPVGQGMQMGQMPGQMEQMGATQPVQQMGQMGTMQPMQQMGQMPNDPSAFQIPNVPMVNGGQGQSF